MYSALAAVFVCDTSQQAVPDGEELHIRVEDITFATITGDCLLRLAAVDNNATSTRE